MNTVKCGPDRWISQCAKPPVQRGEVHCGTQYADQGELCQAAARNGFAGLFVVALELVRDGADEIIKLGFNVMSA